MKGLKPLPGKAVVQLLGFYDNDGIIIVPEAVADRRKCEAKLLGFTHGRKAKERVDLTAAMEAEAVIILKPFAGTQPFVWGEDKNLCIVLVDDIEAWSPVPLGIRHGEHADGAVPRCHYCGPAIASKSSNAMLMVEGPEGHYCPRCLRDKRGNIVDPDVVILSEEEERSMQL